MFTAVSAQGEPGAEQRGTCAPHPSPRRWDPAHDCPHLQQRCASPCLSPVSTQILMLASVRMAMVSGTPCCSLSSMAVAPSSCGTRTGEGSAQAALRAPPVPTFPAHTPSCRAPPRRTAGPGGPRGPQGLHWHGAAAQPSPHSSSPPGPCRPTPASAAPRQRIPASGHSWAQTDPKSIPTPRSPQDAAPPQPCLLPPTPLTFRWSVVTLVRSWLEGCRRSSRMVSAPLQYSRILPSGLRTAGRGGTGCQAQGCRSRPSSKPQPHPCSISTPRGAVSQHQDEPELPSPTSAHPQTPQPCSHR